MEPVSRHGYPRGEDQVIIMAPANAMNASLTRSRISVQITNLMKPQVCHELVRSIPARLPAGSPRR